LNEDVYGNQQLFPVEYIEKFDLAVIEYLNKYVLHRLWN
jgi:hypothetical protein